MQKTLVIVLALFVSACSTFRDAGRQSEAELYQTAIGHIEASRWDQAIDALEDLDSRFPFGPYARNGQLWTVYAHLRAGNEALTRTSADRFLRLNPEDELADYALYLRGLASFQEGFSLVSRYLPGDNFARDPSQLLEAAADFRQLIQQYPDSPYVDDVKLRLVYTRARLAEQEVEIARYYVDRQAWVAAANRASVVIDNFPSSPAVIDALVIKAISSEALGEPELAQRALATLAANYPQYVEGEPGAYRIPASITQGEQDLSNRLSFGLMGNSGSLNDRLLAFSEARRSDRSLRPENTLAPNVAAPRGISIGREAGTETFF